MPFEKMVLFTMNLTRRSIQMELTKFNPSFADGISDITNSAFNQSRKRLRPEPSGKLRPEVFRKLLEVTTGGVLFRQ